MSYDNKTNIGGAWRKQYPESS